MMLLQFFLNNQLGLVLRNCAEKFLNSPLFTYFSTTSHVLSKPQIIHHLPIPSSQAVTSLSLAGKVENKKRKELLYGGCFFQCSGLLHITDYIGDCVDSCWIVFTCCVFLLLSQTSPQTGSVDTLANHRIFQRINIKAITYFFPLPCQGFMLQLTRSIISALNRLGWNICFLYAPSTDCIKLQWINSVEKQSNVALLAAGWMLFTVVLHYLNGLLFSTVSFFTAQKAGYNHPPPLDSWRQLIIRRPKTHVWCFYLVREAQLYQAIPCRLLLYKEILSPTGWDLICL